MRNHLAELRHTSLWGLECQAETTDVRYAEVSIIHMKPFIEIQFGQSSLCNKMLMF